MTWSKLWMDLFGTTSFCGIDMGFWAAMSAVLLLVILMNVVFWGMSPKKDSRETLLKRVSYDFPIMTELRKCPIGGLLSLQRGISACSGGATSICPDQL